MTGAEQNGAWVVEIAVVVALISAVSALVVALVNGRTQRRNAAAVEAMRGANETALETLRVELRTADAREALVQQYQYPLAQAAYDLQSRIWNIVHDDFLCRYVDRDFDSRGRYYAVDNTVWLFAQYLGWVEVIRREIQFLPADPVMDRNATVAMRDVSHVLSSFRANRDQTFQVFRGVQRAIGEVVITRGYAPDGTPRSSCMGYARFLAKMSDPASAVGRWTIHLREDLAAATTDREAGRTRLIALQNALIELVEALDPGPEHRLPTQRRKLPTERSRLPLRRRRPPARRRTPVTRRKKLPTRSMRPPAAPAVPEQ